MSKRVLGRGGEVGGEGLTGAGAAHKALAKQRGKAEGFDGKFCVWDACLEYRAKAFVPRSGRFAGRALCRQSMTRKRGLLTRTGVQAPLACQGTCSLTAAQTCTKRI